MTKLAGGTHNKNTWCKLFALLPALLLSACVDNGGTKLADGIGGTGIIMGRLTGFGSVHVNGVDFNTDNARFVRDGKTITGLNAFNVGEIVTVTGTVNADRKSGTATEVTYSDILEGPVTKAATGKLLEVLGQQVTVDKHTVFHGFRKITELQTDNIVEVSGYTGASGKILATSIKLIGTQFSDGDNLEVEGSITELNTVAQTFRINDLMVNYAQAMFEGFTKAEINNDLYLIATTNQNIQGDVMVATTLTLVDDALEADVTYEIEGFITQFNSASDFEIDGFPVITNADTSYKNGNPADLYIDSFMVLTGTVNSQGILVAEEIILLDYDAEIFVEANIEFIDPEEKTITLLGQTIAVDSFTLYSDDTIEESSELDFGHFNVGEPVFVIAYPKTENQYIATRLSRINSFDSLYVSGLPTAPDSTQGQLTLFDNRVISDGDTFYLDEAGNDLSRTAFFDLMSERTAYIDITGQQLSTGFILAETMALGEEQ